MAVTNLGGGGGDANSAGRNLMNQLAGFAGQANTQLGNTQTQFVGIEAQKRAEQKKVNDTRNVTSIDTIINRYQQQGRPLRMAIEENYDELLALTIPLMGSKQAAEAHLNSMRSAQGTATEEGFESEYQKIVQSGDSFLDTTKDNVQITPATSGTPAVTQSITRTETVDSGIPKTKENPFGLTEDTIAKMKTNDQTIIEEEVGRQYFGVSRVRIMKELFDETNNMTDEQINKISTGAIRAKALGESYPYPTANGTLDLTSFIEDSPSPEDKEVSFQEEKVILEAIPGTPEVKKVIGQLHVDGILSQLLSLRDKVADQGGAGSVQYANKVAQTEAENGLIQGELDHALTQADTAYKEMATRTGYQTSAIQTAEAQKALGAPDPVAEPEKFQAAQNSAISTSRSNFDATNLIINDDGSVEDSQVGNRQATEDSVKNLRDSTQALIEMKVPVEWFEWTPTKGDFKGELIRFARPAGQYANSATADPAVSGSMKDTFEQSLATGTPTQRGGGNY
jgi:hypothetical protein